jgi:hypothetical protein
MSELVSIVVPIYNSAQFLKESLESIINQTYSNIEIICVNDGSTDNSLEILKLFSDKITIINQENQGLASALNAGIKIANGKWFKWFSPDDIMYSYAIESLVNVAKKDPNIIVYSNWEIINENGEKQRNFYESNYNELSNFDYSVRLLDGMQINVNTILIPLFVFEKCEIRELDDPVAIDYDLLLRASLLYKIKFHLIQKPLIKYRIHTKQLSHIHISKSLDYISKIKHEILQQVDESSRNKLISELENYQNSKSLKRKIMEYGLKSLSIFPSWFSNRIIVFYLNKIRRDR